MSASSDPRRDDLLEAYLDGLLDDAQRAAFAERLRSDPELARQVELQLRIDGALDRLFHVETPSHAQVSAALAAAVVPEAPAILPMTKPLPASESPPAAATKPTAGKVYWAAAGLAAAAAIAWVITALTGGAPGVNGPVFTPRPLVEIYAQAVEAGFEPTYNCDEPEQFATTFKQRQGQPLRLMAMASGAKMLGLAYTGGLSRPGVL
jgi:anti-sigma factor RsiW